MWDRLLLIGLLAAAAYAVYIYFDAEAFVTRGTGPAGPVETPAPAMPIQKQIPYPEIQVSPSGPNAPNVAAEPEPEPRRIHMKAPEPQASDPYDDTLEYADAPPNLRHPERSFGPGIVPEKTRIAEEAGVAGPVAASAQAFQQFSPEFIQNGGSFFGTVSANEDDTPNYSAF